jgi:hypothetical protein
VAAVCHLQTRMCQSQCCQSIFTRGIGSRLVRRKYLVQLAVAKQPRCWFGLDRMSAVARTLASIAHSSHFHLYITYCQE